MNHRSCTATLSLSSTPGCTVCMIAANVCYHYGDLMDELSRPQGRGAVIGIQLNSKWHDTDLSIAATTALSRGFLWYQLVPATCKKVPYDKLQPMVMPYAGCLPYSSLSTAAVAALQ